jgi:large subunit ribosomal protein L9
MSTQIILLERVENLGAMGDVVAVKPGYARNFLLPQKKALRATKENIAYFETQKAHLLKVNAEKKAEAEAVAKKIEGAKIVLLRQAAEGGQLFGSVTARDIAEAVSAETKQTVTRGMVAMNQNFKTIGLFPMDIALHPEVRVKVTVNVARSAEEADVQMKTGRAVIVDSKSDRKSGAASSSDMDAAKASMLEDGALANEQAEAEEGEKKAAKKSKKDDKKTAEAPASE